MTWIFFQSMPLFFWVAAVGKIGIRDCLYYSSDRTCLFCNGNESISHLFFKCHGSALVWKSFQDFFGLPQVVTSLPRILAWGEKKAKKEGIEK